MAGQVWSSADFDGINSLGHEGGPGSVLAVTAQNPGTDGLWITDDDVITPMNMRPGNTSLDANADGNCADLDDQIRGFAGHHQDGVAFVFGDSSVRLLNESIDPQTYRALSTVKGREVTGE